MYVIIVLALVGFWLYCLLDVIAIDTGLVRNLSKPLWVVIVLLVPVLGGSAWLMLGRPPRASLAPGSAVDPGSPPSRPTPRQGPIGPEDSDAFLRKLDEQRRDDPNDR